MTHILKIAIFSLLLIGIFSTAQAQPPITIDTTTNQMKNSTDNKWNNTTMTDTFPRADQQTTLMAEKLSLSPSQRTRINDIHMRYSDQSHRMVDSLGRTNNMAASKDHMSAMRKKQDEEIRNVLTRDQWSTWEKYQTEQNRMNQTNPTDRNGTNMNGTNPNSPTPTGTNQNGTNMNGTNPNTTTPTGTTPTGKDRNKKNSPTKSNNKSNDDKTKMNNPSSPQPSQTAPPGGNGGN